MKKKVFNRFISLFAFFLLFPSVVKATYASLSLSGGTVTIGKQVTVTIRLNSVDDGTPVQSVGGYIQFDSGYLELVSCSSSLSLNKANNKVAYLDTSGNGMTSGTIGSCTFNTKKTGTTTVKLRDAQGATGNGDISVSSPSTNVHIKEPPSSNNNLSSLSVSPGGINFNGGTSYSTSVGANVTSVSVSAAAQDSKASISGTGSHNINYGANEIKVTVKAEDGSKKTYTINVNRKDDRSKNNNLASLKVSNGKLSPGFSKGNTKYSMEVPFATSKLNVSATAEDPKSKVSISNPDLVAEETTTVKITVTAENGSSKVYTINVKRGKDPNKPLSNNNYLANLSVSTGMLSPYFDRAKQNYIVYLPYEINYIEVNVSPEDTKYATIKKEGSNDLSIGNNLFKYTVTAEDGTTREYTLTVVRAKSLEESNVKVSSNTYLKELSIKGGLITGKFNKKKNVYYYYKLGKKVNIKKAIPEVKTNKVITYDLDKSIVIMVEASNGAKNYYILVEKSIIPIIIILLLVLSLIISFLIIKFKKTSDKVNKNKKEKKEK